jgi:hypothetical protein
MAESQPETDEARREIAGPQPETDEARLGTDGTQLETDERPLGMDGRQLEMDGRRLGMEKALLSGTLHKLRVFCPFWSQSVAKSGLFSSPSGLASL